MADLGLKICAPPVFFVSLYRQNQGSLTAPRDSLIAMRISLIRRHISLVRRPYKAGKSSGKANNNA